MKAVLLEGFGGLDVLKVGEVETPRPGEGQVLVKVAATTINRPDLVQREGKYPPPRVIRRFSAWKWPGSSPSWAPA
jgi:NADPH:quinone reductase-like Zn-dependent oxidoreductase